MGQLRIPYSNYSLRSDLKEGVLIVDGIDPNGASDGYHSIGELYDHRTELYLALCRSIGDKGPVWKSRLHSDGSSIPGWFILGIGRDEGSQITYHLPDTYWDRVTGIRVYERAPEFDGHTSVDVLERLRRL